MRILHVLLPQAPANAPPITSHAVMPVLAARSTRHSAMPPARDLWYVQIRNGVIKKNCMSFARYLCQEDKTSVRHLVSQVRAAGGIPADIQHELATRAATHQDQSMHACDSSTGTKLLMNKRLVHQLVRHGAEFLPTLYQRGPSPMYLSTPMKVRRKKTYVGTMRTSRNTYSTHTGGPRPFFLISAN